ncbi:ATP-binding cassette domain-containing protein [Roseobacter sinensis]|uniref:ABC transporter ATP-binding protein/permease n=1 Tax=Roseobacter sinensis TaxID=2931391 RepID=A0ABT3BD15_9RHOB|nr:ABC transporter ATP-binding protein [Roseobacter sp. WL0113]MCV3271299.1 ABC transporter ATP-binding protein/permease [Roseobacter sp. WL0113]
MSALPRILGGGRGRSVALLVVLALGQAAATGLAAFATRDVFAAFRAPAAALPWLALCALAATGLIIGALRFYERLTAEKVGQHFAAALRMKLFKHMARVSARDLAARRNGALALRFVGDLTAVRAWVSLGLARLISALIVLPIATGVLFYMNPEIGLAVAVPVAAGLVLSALLGPRLGPAHRRLRSRRARLAADMSERIPHAPELRLLGRMQIETRRLQTRTEKLVDAALIRARGAALLRAIPDVISGIAATCVFGVALWRDLPAAEAAGALAAVGLMLQPMRALAGVWDRHRAWRIAREKCLNLLMVPKLEIERDEDVTLPPALPNLIFADVSAGALTDMTATALPGQRIGIIGGNGAGKSTLLSLAAGLEHPEAGQVLMGDLSPAALSPRERRETIALIGARSPVLKGSLRRALTMGVQGRPSDAQILELADDFGLSKVVRRLGGLDGTVAEAGRNLSAGELRRVLLTRAALSKPRLLLMDEPDDALDQDGPALVQKLIEDCDATTLLITHNMRIARMMDVLWRVEDGRIVETGAPDDLLVDTDLT